MKGILQPVILVVLVALWLPLQAQQNKRWQQQVNYTLDVTLDDTLHQLTGMLLLLSLVTLLFLVRPKIC